MTNGTATQKPAITMIPAVNIVETPSSFVVTLDIPGAAKERISANIENDTLSVVAEVTAADADINTAKQYRREFSLAQDIDVNGVEAQYEMGVLTITLKKKQQFVPRQIQIN